MEIEGEVGGGEVSIVSRFCEKCGKKTAWVPIYEFNSALGEPVGGAFSHIGWKCVACDTFKRKEY
ncbi:MAG: hypothetical protein ACUVXI_03320 [bacterium]